jgi:hypothetical protein
MVNRRIQAKHSMRSKLKKEAIFADAPMLAQALDIDFE